MRDIKFRAKRLDNGEWVYGYHYIRTHLKGTIEEETVSYIMSFDGIGYAVDQRTVGQYTELKDRNCKEIYEWDICEDVRGFRFVVEWNKDARFLGRGIGKQKEYIRYVGQEPAVMVIGNIHDNTNLLET